MPFLVVLRLTVRNLRTSSGEQLAVPGEISCSSGERVTGTDAAQRLISTPDNDPQSLLYQKADSFTRQVK